MKERIKNFFGIGAKSQKISDQKEEILSQESSLNKMSGELDSLTSRYNALSDMKAQTVAELMALKSKVRSLENDLYSARKALLELDTAIKASKSNEVILQTEIILLKNRLGEL